MCQVATLPRFNPHARVGRDSRCDLHFSAVLCFNPHARVGRDSFCVFGDTYPISFNPHARVGRDSILTNSQNQLEVSIHTPVWGVTFTISNETPLTEVSIHTPVWGVTNPMALPFMCYQFQSTRPCGA